MNTNPKESDNLPIRGVLTLAYALSLVSAAIMAIVSAAGLLNQNAIYPTNELRQTFVSNDVVNLFIGLPTLLGSMWLTRRGKLVGLLTWPGALLYILYNYIGYLVGVPSGLISLVYAALILLSAYVAFDLLKCINKEPVQERLTGAVPAKGAGWVLLLFGVMFIFRAVSMIVEASLNQTMLPVTEIGVLIADAVLSALWIAGGVSLLRGRPFGYVSGLGLLFAGSMLFIGLIMFLLLQPVLTDAALVLTDVIVVLVMGLICFIPFALFLRGAMSEKKPSST